MLSPIATLVLVLLNALRRVADVSPRRCGKPSRRWLDLDAGESAFSLEGKVVCTRAARIRGHEFHHHDHTLRRRRDGPHRREPVSSSIIFSFCITALCVTLVLVAALGAVFLKGFKEAIGIAVLLVAVYLVLNLTVVVVGFYEIITHPTVLWNWKTALFQTYRNPFLMIGTAFIVFPKLALGLSGFETGVVVMPLVRGDRDLSEEDFEAIHTTRSARVAAQRARSNCCRDAYTTLANC